MSAWRPSDRWIAYPDCQISFLRMNRSSLVRPSNEGGRNLPALQIATPGSFPGFSRPLLDYSRGSPLSTREGRPLPVRAKGERRGWISHCLVSRGQLPYPALADLPSPCRLEGAPYNDYIRLEAYRPPDLTYVGKQRRGIHEPLGGRRSFAEHIRAALGESFPFASETPFPKETVRDAIFSRGIPPGQLVPFWDAQLSALSALVGSCKLAQSRWGACVPSEIRPSSGKFQTVALKQLMAHRGLGGSRWPGQFAFGVPIAGHLSQKYLFESDGKEQDTFLPSHLYDTARSRARERGAKSGHKNAHVLWAEAFGQVGKGCLLPPQQLHTDGRPLRWKSGSCNISFTFRAIQADKLRACDDLKHSLTNLACTVPAPIQLVTWVRLAQLSLSLSPFDQRGRRLGAVQCRS